MTDKKKNDRRNALGADFITAPIVNQPAVDAQVQEMLQQSADIVLSKKKTAAQKRKVLSDRARIKKTIDILPALKEALDSVAAKNRIVASDVYAFLLLQGLNAYLDGETDWDPYLVTAHSPKVDWKINYRESLAELLIRLSEKQ
jgi:hypothetical protein